MKHKHAQTLVPVHELIAQRWSSRSFDLQMPVALDIQLALMEAARWAPTCFDEEPWRFVVFDRHSDQVSWEMAQQCLSIWNRPWAERAPVLVLVACATNFTLNAEIQGQANRWAAYDTGAAVENMVLQATAMGLMSRQIGGFDVELTRERFQVPQEFELLAFVAFGYPAADAGHLYTKHQLAEASPRRRVPLADNVFAAQWGGKFNAD
ncbi:MAG: nitroreductase family protein [Gammaproteobacteria bacterium]|nr:nitroreductase family protein [Gammaproteobacteria bacterium]